MNTLFSNLLPALAASLLAAGSAVAQSREFPPPGFDEKKREMLAGVDANGNGVPDNADQYIAENFGVGTPSGVAATRFMQQLMDNHVVVAAGGVSDAGWVSREKAAMSCLLERAQVHSDLVNRFTRPLVLFVSKPWNGAHISYAVDVEKRLENQLKFPKGEEACAFAKVPAPTMPGKPDPASAAYAAKKREFHGTDANRNGVRDDIDQQIGSDFGKDTPNARAASRWVQVTAEYAARLVGGGDAPEWLGHASVFATECVKTRLATSPAGSSAFDKLVSNAFDTPLRKRGLETVTLKHQARSDGPQKTGEEACQLLRV